MDKLLNDPIEQIFETIGNSNQSPSLTLFEDSKNGDISLKTDLNHNEHVLITCLGVADELLNETFPDFNLYTLFLSEFKRNKVSLDRKSRVEFVETMKKPSSHDLLNEASSLKNLTGDRQ